MNLFNSVPRPIKPYYVASHIVERITSLHCIAFSIQFPFKQESDTCNRFPFFLVAVPFDNRVTLQLSFFASTAPKTLSSTSATLSKMPTSSTSSWSSWEAVIS